MPQAGSLTHITTALAMLTAKGLLKEGNTVVIISSIAAGEGTADAVQMRKI